MRQPRLLLHLREEQVEGDDLGRGLHLGEHDLLEPLARVAHHLDDIERGPLGVPRVDAHAQDLLAPVLVLDGVDDLGPGRLLLQRRHRVLEVEEDHVRGEAGALAEHLLARSGDRQARSPREVTGAFRHAEILLGCVPRRQSRRGTSAVQPSYGSAPRRSSGR